MYGLDIELSMVKYIYMILKKKKKLDIENILNCKILLGE